MVTDKNIKFAKEDGEMLDDCSQLKGWIRNPYTKNVHRERTLIINEDIIKKYQLLAEDRGVNRNELMAEVLQEYLKTNKPSYLN